MNSQREHRHISLLVIGVAYFLLFSVAVIFDWRHHLFRFPPITPEFPLTLVEDVAVGIFVGGIVSGLTLLLVRWSGTLRDLSREFHQILGPLRNHEIFLISAFSAIGEEFFFRGFIQAHLGVAVASILFGLLHIGPSRKYLPWTVFAIVLGFVMGALYEWTSNLLVPVTLHFTVNFLNLFGIRRFGAPVHSDDREISKQDLQP